MKKITFIFTIITFLMVIGCSDETSNNTANSSNDNKSLTIAQTDDLQSFDPADNRHTPSDVILSNMFNRLFKRDNPDSMEVVPDLVKEYEMIDDDKWSFKFKEGVTFHNGDSLTAEDVAFSLDRVANNEKL